VCLGGSWGRGESLRLIGGGIYRAERRGCGRPEARRLGGPGNARRSYRARRPRGRAGRVLARLREAVGRLWRIQGGRHRAGRRGSGRGPWAQFSPSLRFSWLGSGQGALGSTEASPRSMATGQRRTATVITTVITICLRFCLPGARRNVRKKFKFEFLKFSTLGDQHIGQGIQWYFCSEERMSFAEILFQILL
jgi:hypothetical protein